MPHPRLVVHAVVIATGALALVSLGGQTPERQWLAGDSHIHSQWSPSYDRSQIPPVPTPGGDAIYPTPQNAAMARQFGLAWMVTTDHGGPEHSRFNFEQAYPELLQSRREVPEVLQFYGMELNMPGMDHHTLIIPRTEDEREMLRGIESGFDANEAFPVDPDRNTAEARRAALDYVRTLPHPPLLFANHPSRSALGPGEYGMDEPWELRANHDQAPEIYRGMEGAPGHQAAGLDREGQPRQAEDGIAIGSRGAYRNPDAATMGGFDQMTAVVGGLWDALLGEGRRFWIVATSDSHVHYTEVSRQGIDFWPGEFQKTYVHARHEYDDILDGLREGRIFVSAGELVTSLDVEARSGGRVAGLGETLTVDVGARVMLDVRFVDPVGPNGGGRRPAVRRVDVIIGEVTGPGADPDLDRNPTTRVLTRVTSDDWVSSGEERRLTVALPSPERPFYVRVRGTSTDQLEPEADPAGEDPWTDLWFYSNPIFFDIDVR